MNVKFQDTDLTLFAGVFFDPMLDSQVTSGAPNRHSVLQFIYNIMAAIPKMLLVVSQGHVLLGNNIDLTPKMLDQNSSAQSCCVSHEEK
jgi:hypothetical protein